MVKKILFTTETDRLICYVFVPLDTGGKGEREEDDRNSNRRETIERLNRKGIKVLITNLKLKRKDSNNN